MPCKKMFICHLWKETADEIFNWRSCDLFIYLFFTLSNKIDIIFILVSMPCVSPHAFTHMLLFLLAPFWPRAWSVRPVCCCVLKLGARAHEQKQCSRCWGVFLCESWITGPQCPSPLLSPLQGTLPLTPLWAEIPATVLKSLLSDQKPALGFIQPDTFLLSTAGHEIICHYHSLLLWIRAFQIRAHFKCACHRIKQGNSPVVKGKLQDSNFSLQWWVFYLCCSCGERKSRCPPAFQEQCFMMIAVDRMEFSIDFFSLNATSASLMHRRLNLKWIHLIHYICSLRRVYNVHEHNIHRAHYM